MIVYWQLLRVTVDQYFVYRLNFILWRFRVILNLLLIYFLWSALFIDNHQLFGYTQEMMLTYVLMTSVFSDIVFSSKIHEIGVEIMQGDIINRLLKPISFFSFVITKEIADKAINVLCSLTEITMLLLLVQPHLSSPPSISASIVALVFLFIGIFLSFFLSFCIAMIAFWSSEIWAPRFIYFMMVFMLAGNYFPLDILPKNIYNILLYTPFPYFIFMPAHILLKGYTNMTLLYSIIGLFWIGVFYMLAVYLWKRGMKEFSFYGKWYIWKFSNSMRTRWLSWRVPTARSDPYRMPERLKTIRTILFKPKTTWRVLKWALTGGMRRQNLVRARSEDLIHRLQLKKWKTLEYSSFLPNTAWKLHFKAHSASSFLPLANSYASVCSSSLSTILSPIPPYSQAIASRKLSFSISPTTLSIVWLNSFSGKSIDFARL